MKEKTDPNKTHYSISFDLFSIFSHTMRIPSFFFFIILCFFLIPISCTSITNRRILHQPFFPNNTVPPPPPPPPTPKIPFSSSTSAPNNSPFFPNYPSPPPPPSPSHFASFPANISSLILPRSPEKSKHSSHKLLTLAFASVISALFVGGVIVFFYCRKRRLKRLLLHSTADAKSNTTSNNNSIRIFTPFPNADTTARSAHKLRANRTPSSSEFLYLGTLVNSRAAVDDSTTDTDSRGNTNCVSPELCPLPPLSQQASFKENHYQQQQQQRQNGDVASSAEDDEEFYSPRVSLGGTGSGSKRDFAAVPVNGDGIGGRDSESSSCSRSSSSSRSLSASISPPTSLSPRRSEPNTETAQAMPTQSVFAMMSPLESSPDQNIIKSPSLSIASTSPDTRLSPSRFNLLNRNELSSASTSPEASTSRERELEKDPDDESSKSFTVFEINVNAGDSIDKKQDMSFSPRSSSISSSSSDSASPDRISKQSENASPSKSNESALSSSPDESPRRLNFIDQISSSVGVKNALEQPISAPRPPPPPPPPPPPSILHRQRTPWELPVVSTPVGQAMSQPPALVPPSRPFVMQNTTKVSPVELPASSKTDESVEEEASKPKLKPLHWDKVRASSDREMVWDHLHSSSFKLNEEMIESLFVVNTPSSKPSQTTPRLVVPSPNLENRVLDPKKSQNIAILLRALNVTVEEVCEALLEGNAETLGTELLESLLKMAPTKEEERKLKEYKDESPTKLGPAEKFLKAVLDVPFAFRRVDAMLYITNFESEVEYLKKSFETLEAACEELRNSRMFLKLLEAVLKTGNRMNVGTNRGDAHAFKLDTLLKLVDVKGADGKTTLLHFVVQEIIRAEGSRLSGANQNPNTSLSDDAKCRKLGLQIVSGISSDLNNVKKAAAMDSDVLSSDVSKLSRGLGNIGEVVRLNGTTKPDESSKKFSESMNRFMRMAEEEIIRIQAHESVALSLVKEITEYFHGNSAREEAHPFRIFMVVRDFLTVLDRVCKEVGMINERTIVSNAHKFPVPVNPMLPQAFTEIQGRRQCSSSDDEGSPP